ncbi:MAG: insulinase family protein [Deltaproteobacteria bacterium]|nr:insulinase family protein [Deltaproteobacteria bacterium]
MMRILSWWSLCAILAPLPALAKTLAAAPPADATPVFVDEPYRATPPVAGKPRPAPTPKPQLFSLKNGIEVILVERHQLPTVTMEIQLVGGSRLDPPDRRGRASACTQLWGDGSDKRDKLQLAEALADLGSSFGASATTEHTSFELATMTRNLAQTLDLFTEVLLHPGLRPDELGRITGRRKAALLAAKSNPGQLASRLIGALAYGPANPRGWLTTDASLSALRVTDCRAYVDGHGPVGATLFVVGDITRDQVVDHLERRLGGWRALGRQDAAPAEIRPVAGTIFLSDVPGAEQSVVAMFHPGPQRVSQDFDATQVLAAILSSGFSSRINQNLREKHGWAYGAGGTYGYSRDGSVLVIQASVRADATGPSVREILQEMKTVRESEVSAEELSREKEGAILSLPARWSTGRSIGSTFEALRYFGLPWSYYDAFVERVHKVDTAAVLAAARAWVRPDKAQLLVVGDWSKVRAQVEGLTADGPWKGAAIVRVGADGEVLR